MKRKQITATLLAAALSVTTLAACSSNGSGQALAPAAEGGKTVELTFMGWEASPLETAAVKNGIAAFEAAYPNIKVNYTSAGAGGSDYVAKMLSVAASNSLPDIMFVATESLQVFAGAGVLLDITDRFDKEYPMEDFIESSREIMNMDGHVYGVSSCSVSPVVYYNKDVFDGAGIPYPGNDPDNAWTIGEFRETARALTGNGIYGVYGLETIDPFPGMVISNGGSIYNEDYTKATLNTPEVKEVLEVIKAIRIEDGSAPDSSTLDSVGMTAAQMLETGKVAMLVAGSWALQELGASGMNIGTAPMPVWKGSTSVTTGQAHLHSITSNSKHPEEAWEFLKFLSGMDYQGTLVKDGLWLPNRKFMYEDAQVAQWYNEDTIGEDYKAMLSYFKDAVVDPIALQKTSKFRDIWTEETDMYWKENKDIDVVLAEFERRVNEAIEEALEE